MGQDNDGNDVDDVSLLPSPSPSSQDLIPWMPTPTFGDGKEVFVESCQANGHSIGSFQPFEDDPNIVIEGQCLVFQNNHRIKSGAYKAIICVSIILDIEEENGWFHLVIPGLPRTCIGNIGVFCYQLSPDHGIEFRTANFLASKIADRYFTGDFVQMGDLSVPLRPCNSKDYGIVDDIVINHEIKASILVAEHDWEVVERTHLCVTYHAICSPRLQGLCIWAERCSFRICIVGGPEGYFDCQLDDTRPGLQIFRLDSEGLNAIGKTYVKVISSPQKPGIFGITWRTDLDDVIPSTLLPRIYPGINEGEGSSTLQDVISRIHITDTRTGSPKAAQADDRCGGNAKSSLATSKTSLPSKRSGRFYAFEMARMPLITLPTILAAPLGIFRVRGRTLFQLLEITLLALLALSCYISFYQLPDQSIKGLFEGTGSWVAVAAHAKHEFLEYVCQHVQSPHDTTGSQVPFQSEGSVTSQSANGLGHQEVAIDIGSRQEDGIPGPDRLFYPGKLVDEKVHENQPQVPGNEHETTEETHSSLTTTDATTPSPILTSDAETVQPSSLRDKLDYMLGWKGPIVRVP
jgi:hypothetical protein